MTRAIPILLVAALAAACSTPGPGEGDVVDRDTERVVIGIGYGAANEGVDTRIQAAEHCAETDRKAVWYGHDKDGNMVYRCE